MLGRRNLLLSAGALVSGIIAGGSRTARGAERTLRIGYILPLQSQLGAGATAFAEEVSKRTGGRIAIQQFPDATLGGDVELLKAAQLGMHVEQVDAGSIVDEDGGFDHLIGGGAKLLAFLLIEVTGAELLGIDAGRGAQHSLCALVD